jgi:murein tripeptide amidase MpaA
MNMINARLCLAATLCMGSFLAVTPALGQPAPTPLPNFKYDAPFFPGANHDPNVPTPDSILGFPVGEKPASSAQIEAVIKALESKSPRCRVFTYGKTHEGRTLYNLFIASEKNLARLDALKGDYAKLADPRMTNEGAVDALVETLPALAWMAYVIHGDEMSGSDASLAVAHHLAAGTDADVVKMLDDLVIVIDPLMNPDGRDRFINSQQQNRTSQPSVDDQSLLHTGFWPRGRMNHYLFDLNRDWIFATQPETRGRIAAINEWHPHYMLESHEMDSQDTFLFQPAREPFNPNAPAHVQKWMDIFAKDQGAALDAMGWRYYTGEWNEEWYPGYSGAWANMRNIVENLYEQANIGVDAVRRPEGTLQTYRESVHHQLVSTMANLTTLAKNRKEVLRDFVAARRKNVKPEAGHVYAKRVFAVPPSANAGRMKQFLDLMALQGIEVYTAKSEFTAEGKDRLGLDVAKELRKSAGGEFKEEIKARKLPAGTLLIPNAQPEAHLVGAMLEFDPHMSDKFVTEERRELLRYGRSKLYDITGWNITMLFDLDCVELTSGMPADVERWKPPAAAGEKMVEKADSKIACVMDGTDDRSVAAAGRLMERGVWVRVAEWPFAFDGKEYPRGSLVIEKKDNLNFKGDLAKEIGEVASETGVKAVGVGSGMGPGDLPDLGGGHFILLHRPRIAVVGREPFGAYSFGTAWYQIDHVLGLRASYVDAHSLDGADLRRYNVLVLPDGGADAIKDKMDELGAWVKAGGTLIAIGSSAAAIAKEKDGIGSTRMLPNVLGKLDDYRQAIVREWEGQTATTDASAVWSQVPPTEVVYPWMIGSKDDKPSDDELKRRDAWRAIFMPSGAVLAGRVDDKSWLTAGCGEYVPVVYSGDNVMLVPGGVQAPVRLGAIVPALPKPPEEKDKAAKGDADKPEASENKALRKKDQPEAAPGSGSKNEPKTSDGKKKESLKEIMQPSGGRSGDSADGKRAKSDEADDNKSDKDKKDDKPAPGWTIAPPNFELRLRMSGLLWPEASERIANSAYVTREQVGAGQVILFAGDPVFRAAALGTTRVFSNAVVYGPGMGARQAIKP